MEETTTPQVQVQPADPAKTKKIWTIAGYLAIITGIEFAIAFMFPASLIKNWVFIILTIFKAFFIVRDFMHLGHEKKSLIMSILLPMTFVIFLIFILWYQGTAIYNLLYTEY